jgi:hypothetical protein
VKGSAPLINDRGSAAYSVAEDGDRVGDGWPPRWGIRRSPIFVRLNGSFYRFGPERRCDQALSRSRPSLSRSSSVAAISLRLSATHCRLLISSSSTSTTRS